jgi:hypothetical protein
MNVSSLTASRLFQVFFRSLIVFSCGLIAACWASTLFRSSLPWYPIFADAVVRIITVLDKTDDRPTAQAVQAKALVVLQSPAITNAIKD